MVFSLVIDKDYGGFYVSIKKKMATICLGYIALRFYFFSENKLHNIIAVAVRSKSGY